MIVDAVNDHECLDQLTAFARELSPTTLIRSVAQRLGTREAAIKWFQSLPQADDLGDEHVRFIQCDVPQRARLLPDDPNCVERSLGALMLLEVIDPKTPRALATIEKPLRHTGLVEKHGAIWRAVDLFPRRNAARNFDWGKVGGDVLQGVHRYVGKPILKFYLGDAGGQAADTLGQQEDQLIGRDKKKPTEKQGPPPPAGAQSQRGEPKPQPQKGEPAKAQPAPNRSVFAALASGAGATQAQPNPTGGGGKDGEKEESNQRTEAATVDGAAHAREGAHGASTGDRDSSHQNGVDEGEEASSLWWILGRK